MRSARAVWEFGSRVETDLAPGWNGHFQHLPNCCKNGMKFCIVALFHIRDFPAQIFVCGEHGAKLEKRTHDGDVDLDGAVAAENAREHGDAVLRKDKWKIAAATMKRGS